MSSTVKTTALDAFESRLRRKLEQENERKTVDETTEAEDQQNNSPSVPAKKSPLKRNATVGDDASFASNDTTAEHDCITE